MGISSLGDACLLPGEIAFLLEDRILFMTTHNDVFGARATLEGVQGTVTYYRLNALAQRGEGDWSSLAEIINVTDAEIDHEIA